MFTFLDITEVSDLQWKNIDVSRTQWVCHVIYIYIYIYIYIFGSSLGKV